MTAFVDDLRLAVRSLARSPALSATLLLSMGVGVGSNVVVHGFTRGLTLADDGVSPADTLGVASAQDPAQASDALSVEQREAVRRLDGVLGIAAGLVLMIALGNVASLLLGRSVAQAQETSMRLALGASRARLTGRVLAESLVIAMAARRSACWSRHGSRACFLRCCTSRTPRS